VVAFVIIKKLDQTNPARPRRFIIISSVDEVLFLIF
jgi:hypothetical protein